ncbi:MAG: class I SAM-dependent methyltransferase [Candidatus Cloacimonetes bacterium]|nr:class I SAM-dependent methyltransferase [Candidatus Cloacimonadota bacterium]
MPIIKIISTLASDTEQILSAFKFFPFAANVFFELHCLDIKTRLSSPSPALIIYPCESIEKLCQLESKTGDILIFSSLGAYKQYKTTKSGVINANISLNLSIFSHTLRTTASDIKNSYGVVHSAKKDTPKNETNISQIDSTLSNQIDSTLSKQIDSTPSYTTLYVHNDIALLEISGTQQFPDALLSSQLQLCVLEDDPARNIIPIHMHVLTYKDIREYKQNLYTKNILLTSNHNMVLAIISMDKANWEISHPAMNARNLALELWDDAFSHILNQLNHAQKRLTDISSQISNPFDIALIRKFHNDDKHAYSFFANHYDEYMAHVDYDLWVKRTITWHKQYTDAPLTRILEVACGTANVSNRFVLQGYHVDASDLSAEMLHIADQKPLKPNLYQASLTDPIPEANYNLVLCMFDSVNYLTRSMQFITMLQHVYDALADKGLFIFDISTLFNSEENFADVCNLSHHEEGYLVHQAWFDSLRNSQNSSLTSFKKDFIGYSHQYELHKQRVYLCSDIITLIHKTSFKLKAIHSSESKLNFYPRHIYGLDDKYPRLFFILKKESI